jgi:four helix bundle protein
MFNFEKLEVWQVSVEYADAIYLATRSFPVDERFGLTSQLRRAAVSISSNIAEGCGRVSNRDFVRFVQIAYGSLMESVSQLKIARRQGLVEESVHQDLYRMAERVARMLSGLRASLTKDSPEVP